MLYRCQNWTSIQVSDTMIWIIDYELQLYVMLMMRTSMLTMSGVRIRMVVILMMIIIVTMI